MSDSAINKRFVEEILNDEGKRFIRNQGLSMKKLLQFHSSQTFDDRSFSVESSSEYDGKLIITQRANVRFLDIKKRVVSRATRRSKISQFKLYNQFAFGHYYSIANRLMVDLTSDVKERIRKELNLDQNG